ncbi:MAG TPA: CBASS cGAMP-activated phospholipase [Gammaproteobacteria bacterium]
MKQPWPSGKPFRILSIDGGGIKGLFAARLLSELEISLPRDKRLVDCFDMIVGTSTGGILALGIGLEVPCSQIYNLYVSEGKIIFSSHGIPPWIRKPWQFTRRIFTHGYESAPLERALRKVFGNQLFGESVLPLCVPAFEARYGDPNIFKTPHHPDYYLDGSMPAIEVALATSAAPTYFRPRVDGGYVLLDGGVLANNPAMVGIVDALACFDIAPKQIRLTSIGFGDKPYVIPRWKTLFGGMWLFRKISIGMMSIQSKNTMGQAKLLLGSENILRIEPELGKNTIELDDYDKSMAVFPSQAIKQFSRHKKAINAFTATKLAKNRGARSWIK